MMLRLHRLSPFALVLLAAACKGPSPIEPDAGTPWVDAGSEGGGDAGDAAQGGGGAGTVAQGGGGAGGELDDGGLPDGGAPDGDAPDAGPAPDPADPLFAGSSVALIDLVLEPGAISSLNADPKTYVHGDFQLTLGGETTALGSIGVRLKGNYGSFRGLDEKAAFLLKFDKFTDGQLLFGLEKLALNNMVQDPSMIHERLGYRLFREGDVPAPRSGYATVRVNGELYGLYAVVEPVDNPGFLTTWFGDTSGSLYEGAYGSDLWSEHLPSFDQDNGPDLDYADLQELVDALDGMTNPDTFLSDAAEVLDMDRYVAFAATELFLGHWDGYAVSCNNYYLYRRADGRWTFLPWGLDQTFADNLDPWSGTSRIQSLCNASPPCRIALAQAFEDVIARADQLGLAAEAEQTRNVIWSDAEADPRKEADLDTLASSVNDTIDFLEQRPAALEASLACADPSTVDLDGDGYLGCGYEDCNDDDSSVHPDAPELCNFADDDCDGAWDDDPSCPSCVMQPDPAGGTLAFCFVEHTWTEAEADCVEQGGHLVSLHDQAEHDAVVTGANAVRESSWWIGLSDAATEGEFAWSDGTASDFSAWGDGEPNNVGEEDCAHLADWSEGRWNDSYCDARLPYVCRLP